MSSGSGSAKKGKGVMPASLLSRSLLESSSSQQGSKNKSKEGRSASASIDKAKAKAKARLLEQENDLAGFLFGSTTSAVSETTAASDFLPRRDAAPAALSARSKSSKAPKGPSASSSDKTSASWSSAGGDSSSASSIAGAAAWVDDDDAGLQVSIGAGAKSSRVKKLRTSADEDSISGKEYEQRLRAKQKEIVKSQQGQMFTDWAAVDNDDSKAKSKKRGKADADSDSDSDDDYDEQAALGAILSSTASVLSSPTHLPKGEIASIRCKDVNMIEPNKSTTTSVHFHPSGELALTAGYDKTLRFFQVDGKKNAKIHGVFFPDLPISRADFVNGGESVLLTGRRPFLYTYNVVAGVVEKVPQVLGRKEKSWESFASSPDGRTIALLGNDGYVVLLSAKSWQTIGEVKMNGAVRAVAFTPCGGYVVASGSDGDVYRWDVRLLSGGRCVSRFKNQDGTFTSSLAVSSRYTAVGAESGVVNLYDDRDANSMAQFLSSTYTAAREPAKAFMNIKTSADLLKFNNTGEILAMSSRRDMDCMKLAHLPSASVFSNWPTSKTPLGYVWSMDFSPNSGYMAIGNDKGKCLLYRLSHYKSV